MLIKSIVIYLLNTISMDTTGWIFETGHEEQI
jgi:hypothetical protein